MCISINLETKPGRLEFKVKFVKTYETWFSLSHNCLGWLILTGRLYSLLFMLIGISILLLVSYVLTGRILSCKLVFFSFFTLKMCSATQSFLQYPLQLKYLVLLNCDLHVQFKHSVLCPSSFYCTQIWLFLDFELFFAYEYVHVLNKFLINEVLEIHPT